MAWSLTACHLQIFGDRPAAPQLNLASTSATSGSGGGNFDCPASKEEQARLAAEGRGLIFRGFIDLTTDDDDDDGGVTMHHGHVLIDLTE